VLVPITLPIVLQEMGNKMSKDEMVEAIRSIRGTLKDPVFGENLNSIFENAQEESDRKFKMLEPKERLMKQAYSL
jgi:hypothetical protein